MSQNFRFETVHPANLPNTEIFKHQLDIIRAYPFLTMLGLKYAHRFFEISWESKLFSDLIINNSYKKFYLIYRVSPLQDMLLIVEHSEFGVFIVDLQECRDPMLADILSLTSGNQITIVNSTIVEEDS